jgi:hypothetical protein
MNALSFLVLGLATWRFSSLLVNEEGPFDMFQHFRNVSGVKYDEYSVAYGTNILSNIISCIWCTSVWVAWILIILAAFWQNVVVVLCAPFALSAIAIIIESWVRNE